MLKLSLLLETVIVTWPLEVYKKLIKAFFKKYQNFLNKLQKDLAVIKGNVSDKDKELQSNLIKFCQTIYLNYLLYFKLRNSIWL